MQSFITLLTNTEHTLEKKRTTKLARHQWADLVEIEAQIKLCVALRKQLADEAMTASQQVAPHPIHGLGNPSMGKQ